MTHRTVPFSAVPSMRVYCYSILTDLPIPPTVSVHLLLYWYKQTVCQPVFPVCPSLSAYSLLDREGGLIPSINLATSPASPP